MKTKKHFFLKSLLIAFLALFLGGHALQAQTFDTSIKVNFSDFALSTDRKTISYVVYVQDIDPDHVCGVMFYTIRAKIPSSFVTSPTVSVSEGDAILGAGSPTATLSGSDYILKFSSTATIVTWDGTKKLDSTFPGTKLGKFSLTSATPFPDPVTFPVYYSGVATVKSQVNLFYDGTNTLLTNATGALPLSTFTGIGANATSPTTYVLTTTPPSALSYTTPNLYTIGTPITNLTPTVTGAGITYSVSPALPAGLSLDASTGIISGTPTEAVSATDYRVTATNSAGNTYFDVNIAVSKKSQNITFGILTAKTYGDASFNLTGTASSGLVVAYSSSNHAVATISGSTVTIVGAGSTTITAAQVGDATYSAATSVDQSLSITAIPLTITGVTAANKSYDGTSAATLSGGTLNGILNSDDVTIVAGTGAFADADVSTGKTVTATGYSLGGAKAGNYTLPVQPTVASADITAAPLTITGISISNKPYDGNTTATIAGTAAYSGLQNGESFSVSGVASASFSDSGVGIGKTVIVTGYTAPNANYTLSSQPIVTADITAIPLSITGVTASNKVYDGTTVATLSGGVLNGVLNLDNVMIVSGTGSFADANVGTGKAVTATGYSLSGSKAANYTLSAQPSGLTADITKASQTISFGPIATQVFGASPFSLSASASSGLPISYASSNPLVATVSGNTVTIVGMGVTIITASQAGNGTYTPAADVPQAFTVNSPTQQVQTITFGSLSNKTYGDSSFGLSATASSGLPVSYASSNPLVATVSGNTVTIVGSGSTIIAASQSGNSTYGAATNIEQVLSVDKKFLTISSVTAASKTYDGTTTATLSGGSLTGVINFDDVTIVSGTGLFADANVGTGKSVTATGYSLGGTKAVNYILSGQPSGLIADITKASQTISFGAIATQVVGASPFSLSATASSGLPVSYSSSNPLVATVSGNIVTIVGVGSTTITASQAGDVTFGAATVDQIFTVNDVTQQAQSITFGSLSSKTYGDASFSLSATASSGLSVSYASSNPLVATVSGNTITIVGSGSTIIAASQSGNSTYGAATNVEQVLTVGKKSLTISSVTAANKTYDGTTTATLSGGSLTGVINSDDVTIVSGIGLFADANVGTGKTVIATGYSLGGTKVLNYSLSAQPSGITAEITKASQTITFGALATRTYGDGAFVLSAVASSGLPISYTSSNTSVATVSDGIVNIVGAGSTTITASQAGNSLYNVATNVDQILTVNAMSLLITGVTAANKPYDGTISAILSGGTLNGVINSDNVTIIPGTGSFVDANVGTNKTITITGYSLGGTKAANYILSSQPILIADITAIPLSITGVTASNKVYDGTTVATLSGGVLNGVLNLDNVMIVSGTGSFADANVGTGKIVTAAGYSLSGAKAGNYTLSAQPSGLTADITKASQTISFGPIATQVSGASPFSLSASASSGLPISYASSNPLVATVSGNTVTIVGMGVTIITASQAGNGTYTPAADVPQAFTVNSPTQQLQTITFGSLSNKTYGDASFSLSATASSGLPISYASSNPLVATVSGNTVMIVGSGSTIIAASQSGNATYGAATNVEQVLTVNKKSLTISSVTASNKVYDGTTTATLSGGALTGIINSDDVTIVPGTGLFADANVGAGKSVTATGYSLGGTKAVNYILSTQPSGLTADITKAPQTITFGSIATQVAGASPFSLSATASSGLPVSYSSSNTSVATVFGNTVTIVGVGNTTITASQAGDATFTATTAIQLFTVNSVTQQVQTITFGSLASKTYGDATFSLSATASSGLSVSYASSNPLVATVSGNTVTIVGSGSTIIAASQSGNSTYGAATNVEQVLTVGKKSLTISSVTAANKTYDGTTTATLSGGGLTGVINSDDVTIVSGTGLFADANVGTGKTVTATGYSLGGTKVLNYTLSAQPSGITADITKASQTITFGALTTRTYGDGAFVLSAVGGASGNPVVFSSSDSNIATCTGLNGSIINIVNSGSCTIYANQAASNNYNAAAQVQQVLTITSTGIAPSNLSYATPVVYATGKAITALTPSVNGIVTSYSVSPVLPVGLSINNSTGIISGTPTTATPVANYLVTATNTNGNTSFAVSITVNDPTTPDIAPSNLSYATPVVYATGSAIINLVPSVIGTVASYSVNPSLPIGLSLNTTTGIISGTPTTATPAANYLVTATNTYGSTNFAVKITVNDPTTPGAAPSNLSYATPVVYATGKAITALTPSVIGTVTGYSVNPALPAGLSLNAVTGVISGTPTRVTPVADYLVTVTNTYGSTNFAVNITVNDPTTPGIAPSNLNYASPVVCVMGNVIATLAPSVIGTVTSYNVYPSLPTGLSFDTTTGIISGTPTVASPATNYLVTATNTNGSTNFAVNITVLAAVTPTSAPANLTYTTPVVYGVGTSITNLTPNVQGTVSSYSVFPTLPSGLVLNSTTGIISGTPSAVTSAADYVVTATNSVGSTSFKLNITIEPAITINSLNGGSVIIGCKDDSSVQFGYSISSGLPTQYKITFDAAAITAGFVNIGYTNLPSSSNSGTFVFSIPNAVEYGVFNASIKFIDKFGVESISYPFQFTINMSSKYVIPKFDDVVLCDNSSNRFVSYQWYKDGVAINGATAQFYCDPEGLSGLYSVEVVTVDGLKFKTCDKQLSLKIGKVVSVYPNPVKTSQNFTVKLSGFNNQELDGAQLTISDTDGRKLYSSNKVSRLNNFSIPFAQGIYIGRVTTINGIVKSFKVIVK